MVSSRENVEVLLASNTLIIKHKEKHRKKYRRLKDQLFPYTLHNPADSGLQPESVQGLAITFVLISLLLSYSVTV